MDLESLKYADLRQLAKSVGLKANMKADKLLQALKRHFEQQENSENGNNVTADDAPIPEEAVAEPRAAAAALVTTRRKKTQQVKRKHSSDAAAPNPTLTESPVQNDAKPPEEEEEEEEEDGSVKRSSKRRKVSSAKDAESQVSKEKPKSANDGAVAEDSQGDVMKKTTRKIPRHEGLMKKKKAPLRPTTPNFKKLHEAHFSKMESIDSYVQRKNKQIKELHNSVKDLKENIKTSADSKSRATPLVKRASLFSPAVLEKKVERKRVAQAPTSKSAIKDSAPFRPSVLSTNKINVRFSQSTLDNEHKRSLLKTPARMSPMPPLTPTSGRKSDVHANKKAASVHRTPGMTPFIFSGTSGTPTTNKKNTFDLKASLSRPLTYKPHSGKLKPFGAPQENAAVNKTLPTRRTNYKQHPAQTRDERRVKHRDDRKQKKEMMLGARRGLVSA